MMLDADFWNDSDNASALVTESKSIKKELDEFSNMIDYLEHSQEMVEFLRDEEDKEIYADLEETVAILKDSVEDFSFRLLFSEEYDNNNAILDIHGWSWGLLVLVYLLRLLLLSKSSWLQMLHFEELNGSL